GARERPACTRRSTKLEAGVSDRARPALRRWLLQQHWVSHLYAQRLEAIDARRHRWQDMMRRLFPLYGAA
ncbi:MAG: hypothetical protein ACK4XK_08485, partial [Casimicrobiaceae bacterium]